MTEDERRDELEAERRQAERDRHRRAHRWEDGDEPDPSEDDPDT
jgi:hypothetical protein